MTLFLILLAGVLLSLVIAAIAFVEVCKAERQVFINEQWRGVVNEVLKDEAL